MEAFRYFGDSDGIIITCRFLICRNRPIGQLTDECRRCGQRTFPLRRKRDAAKEDESNVLTDKSVKSPPIFIAVRDAPDKSALKESGRKSSSNDIGATKTTALIVIAGLVGSVLCVAIAKKVFFNNPATKEAHLLSPKE
uniref:ZP domain-containing protein n=1 Tax=Clytia hemisphaerica TaxID=252671 RepID=A0A7M5X091_9CNID